MDGGTPFLPQDITTNILKRLPVRCLLQFQCVCKDWKNLIKSPSFTAAHLQHSNNHNPCIICLRVEEGDALNLNLLDCEMQVREVQKTPLIDYMVRSMIVCTSNGLLCVRINNLYKSHPTLLLWNPATREIRLVPQNINDFDGVLFSIGFGFSPIINDYKIVMPLFSNHVVYKVEVYSLTSGSWKEVQCVNLGGIEYLEQRNVTTNGVMFWFGSKVGSRDSIIVSFDLAMEVFTLILMPDLDPKSCSTLTVHENRLAMLMLYDMGNFESQSIDLWVMEEAIGSSRETRSWTKKYTGRHFSCHDLLPVTIWRNEILCTSVYDESAIAMFNLTANKFKLHSIGTCYFGHSVFNYVESLVPVGGIKFSIFM